MNYKQYLLSPEWRTKRCDAIVRAGRLCQECKRGDDSLDVHHRNYERLGHERIGDLCVLCRRCHDRFHGLQAWFIPLASKDHGMLALWEEIRSFGDDRTSLEFCRDAVWYGWDDQPYCPAVELLPIKARVEKLVGWFASVSELRTSYAYDIVGEFLYRALPPCRHMTESEVAVLEGWG